MNFALAILLLIGFAGSIVDLKRKHILSSLKPLEMLLLSSILEIIILILYLIFSNQFFPIIQQLRLKINVPVLLSSILVVCLVLGSAFTFSWLTKREKISTLVPVVSIVAIIFTFFGGIFIYNEKWQRKDIFAIILLIVGILILKSN